ncbi:MAG TPA: prolyl oligopeptidase family serine peptidase [Gemmatimonadaceae bacterium]|nr:prolyl oligopeptidase family serine peptidase [Gemmatimonadaceae bacterium]
MPTRFPRLASGVLIIAFSAIPALAQNNAAQPTDPKAIIVAEGYLKPPAVVERIVTAPRGANIALTNQSPDRKWFMKLESEGLPSIADFAKGHIYLGGLQVDTMAFRARSLTTRGSHSITIIDATTGRTRTMRAPDGVDINGATWSPDGKTVGYVGSSAKATHIYLLDIASGRSTQLTRTPLNAVSVTSFQFTEDGSKVVAVLVPQPFRAPPAPPAVATTPMIRFTDGKIAKERIHASLLETPHDKALLEYYATGQLAVIDVKSRAVRNVGAPAMIRAVNASPDAQHFRVTVLEKPFSYIVPTSAFGTTEQLWNAAGKSLVTIARRPLREGEPDSTVTPPVDTAATNAALMDPVMRDKNILGWNPLGPGLLVVVRDLRADSIAAAAAAAARGGRGATGGRGNAGGRGGQGGAAPATGPSKLAVWMPPFGATDLKEVYSSAGRIGAATFTRDGKTLFLTVGNQNYAMRLADTTKHFVLQNASLGAGGGRGGRGGGAGAQAGGGRGGQPNPLAGSVVTREGFVVMASDNRTVFVSGTKQPGANWEKEGPVSWIDKLDIETGTRSRIFEGTPGATETVVAALDDDYTKVILSRESPSEVPNSYLLDLATKARTKLTDNVDPTPEVSQAIRKRVWATRPDGVRFVVDITIPKDWKEGQRLPGLIYFYPTEVSTQESYDQARQSTNINRYPAAGARSAEIWATQGYVVLQPAAIPVFGPQGSMNDNYVNELRDGLYATIEAGVDAGVLDRDRVGLWGHSYGAFSTVNAMVHTKWFKAGIAGDGMYNRSLTPFGFQRESRDFWQAQDVYLRMSPFFNADKLHGALLMYHQTEDQNVGTALISSIRMQHALQGLGKTSALYMYPYEDHGPATNETILDQWARFIAWFDIYVKNAKKTAVVP